MPTYKLGKDSVIYYNAGTYNSPSWTKIVKVGDINIGDSMEKADASNRDSGFSKSVATLRVVTVGFNVRYNPSAASYAALEAAYIARTELDILILDGPLATAGSKGQRLPMQIFGFDKGEPLRDLQTRDVMLEITDGDNEPTTYTVS